MTYVPVHLHTSNGSIGDSIIRLPQLITKAKKLNIKALILTNHGSLSDMYEFYTTCTKNDIKPIIGCEVYITDDRLNKDKREDYHMILIAYNNIGVTNLLDIVSNANTEGFYYKPRTDMSYIKSRSNGLICLTACVGGYIPQLILNNKHEQAKEHLMLLKEVFEDRVCLEIQPGNFEEQILVNKALIDLHKETNTDLIVSNDIHYLNKDEWKTHDFHVRIQRKVKAPEIEGETLYPDKCYYLMSKQELIESFNNSIDFDLLIAALDNTNKLADMCNISFELDTINLPEFECPSDLTPEQYISDLCYERLDKIVNIVSNPNEYIERLTYELSVLKELGYLSYFLIMWDLLKYAHASNIEVGPARGSVAASLVAYLLNITKINPIRFNLMFERFLSKYRRGLP